MTRIAHTAQCALGLLVVLVVALSLAQVQAQAGPEGTAADAGTDPNQLTPPRLLAFVDAGYPEAARATQRGAAVLLALTIGDDGFVEDAVVLEPAGDGFDALAQTAARRFVFEPATRGGQPVRARIQYRYEFRYVPPAAPAAPVEARLTLVLRSAENDKPVRGAELILTSPSEPSSANSSRSAPLSSLVIHCSPLPTTFEASSRFWASRRSIFSSTVPAQTSL